MSPIGLPRIVTGRCQDSSIGIIPSWKIADIYFASSIGFCKNGWWREQSIALGFFLPHHLSKYFSSRNSTLIYWMNFIS